MSDKLLRDLVAAGVRWEITDNSFMVPTPPKTETMAPASDMRRESGNIISEIGRMTSSVVPPIAPSQSISVETVCAMASRPNDMSALCRMIGEFNHPLRACATNTVLPHVGQGSLLIITDIPSSEDDATGTILSGASGELMDKMLAAIGLSRANVSIVPMIFWRTPGGRAPSRLELDLARPFVNRAVELIAPRVILTLGTLPASELMEINLTKSHGNSFEYSENITLVPIYHPNYLILKPAAKRDVWTALQSVQNILKSAEK